MLVNYFECGKTVFNARSQKNELISLINISSGNFQIYLIDF